MRILLVILCAFALAAVATADSKHWSGNGTTRAGVPPGGTSKPFAWNVTVTITLGAWNKAQNAYLVNVSCIAGATESINACAGTYNYNGDNYSGQIPAGGGVSFFIPAGGTIAYGYFVDAGTGGTGSANGSALFTAGKAPNAVKEFTEQVWNDSDVDYITYKVWELNADGTKGKLLGTYVLKPGEEKLLDVKSSSGGAVEIDAKATSADGGLPSSGWIQNLDGTWQWSSSGVYQSDSLVWDVIGPGLMVDTGTNPAGTTPNMITPSTQVGNSGGGSTAQPGTGADPYTGVQKADTNAATNGAVATAASNVGKDVASGASAIVTAVDSAKTAIVNAVKGQASGGGGGGGGGAATDMGPTNAKLDTLHADNGLLKTSLDSANAQISGKVDAGTVATTLNGGKLDTIHTDLSTVNSRLVDLHADAAAAQTAATAANGSTHADLLAINATLGTIKTSVDATTTAVTVLHTDLQGVGSKLDAANTALGDLKDAGADAGKVAKKQLDAIDGNPTADSVSSAAGAAKSTVAHLVSDVSPAAIAMADGQPNWTTTIGGLEVNLNPFAGEWGVVTSWARTFCSWLIIIGFGVWLSKALGEWARGLAMLPQSHGNAIIGGTGSQATALAAAIAISGVVGAGAVALFSYAGSGITLSGVMSSVSSNPLVASPNGGLWLLDQIVPLSTVLGACVARITFNLYASQLFMTAAMVVRFVVP